MDLDLRAPAATELRFNLVYYDSLMGETVFYTISPRRRTGDAEVMVVHIETIDGDLSTSVQPLLGSYLCL